MQKKARHFPAPHLFIFHFFSFCKRFELIALCLLVEIEEVVVVDLSPPLTNINLSIASFNECHGGDETFLGVPRPARRKRRRTTLNPATT